MRIFITTPSYNQLGFLKRCVASIADQVDSQASSLTRSEAGGTTATTKGRDNPKVSISVHHHIQDAGSTDGTREFLQEFQFEVERLKLKGGYENYSFSFASEADEGMYDAVCRGWLRAVAQIDREAGNPPTSDLRPPTSNPVRECVLAYLNCDEQYLEGSLQRVAEWFSGHPRKDVLFGEVLITGGKGEYICSRKMVAPSRPLVQTDHLPFFTAAMFIRKKSLDRHSLFPDPEWKNIGDVELVLRMMNQGVPMGILHQYLTAFGDSGENLGLNESAAREYERLRSSAPWAVRKLRWLWVLNHRIRKLLSGDYRLPSFEYSVYVGDADERHVFRVENPEPRWLSRLG